MQLLLHHSDGHRSQTRWTPDNGPEGFVSGLYAVAELFFRVAGLAAPTCRLFAADGCELCCVSSGDVTLQLGDVIDTVSVSVVEKLHSSLLWHDLMRF